MKYKTADAYFEQLFNDVKDEAPEFEFIDREGVKVRLLEADGPKITNKRRIWADCTKLSDKVRIISGYDFVITFYDVGQLSPRALKVLMLHEMKHIGWNEGKPVIVPHDLEDFRDIVESYGPDWVTTL